MRRARLTRRDFLRNSALAGVGAACLPLLARGEPQLPAGGGGRLVFKPYFPQNGRGPHLLDWAYASDVRTDAFRSDIRSTADGVELTNTGANDEFGIDVRWNVEGFGYLFLTADNAGVFYRLPRGGTVQEFNLPYELARSRVARNERRRKRFEAEGWKASREVDSLLNLSASYVHDASRRGTDQVRQARDAQTALRHALWASEMMEIEKARWDIQGRGRRKEFFVGCDARAFYQMYQPKFLEMFTELFNYATVTTVIDGDDMLVDFEKTEGQYRFEHRDLLVEALRSHGVTVEGRPLFWFHTWVTPDWIKDKSYAELQRYVERHTRDVVSHFGDKMYAWEVMNEFHDWANEVAVTPEQAVELTKLACDVAKATNPKVHRLINNCCPFAEYVQLGRWSGQEAKYPQRTPWQFTRDLVDAGVDFTVIGQQMYFPYRDVQDIVMNLERYEAFRRPLQLSEVGTSSGPTNETLRSGTKPVSHEPYAWRRRWDEELQADWLEAMYMVAYSKPFIEACNWFNFVDPHSYIENGGLLRSPDGDVKPSYERLQKLRQWWDALPEVQQHNRIPED